MINGWRQHFSYDRYGNRRFIITGDSSTTTIPAGCADVVCNPTANQANNRLDGYTYDASGNTQVDASGRQFSYDAENKQTEVRDGNNIVVGRYYYDGDGKRVKKASTTETTVFVYDASGKLVAEYSNQTSQTPQTSYLTQDHLGSPRIITDGNGQVISRRDFTPFGEETTSVNTAQRNINLNYGEDGLRQKFTTYERDDETDLDYAKARYYKPSYGRYTTPDSFSNDTNAFSPQSWNLYAYVRNNPLKFIDSSGKRLTLSINGKVYEYKLKGGNSSLVDLNGNVYSGGGRAELAALNAIDALRSKNIIVNAVQSLVDNGDHQINVRTNNNIGKNNTFYTTTSDCNDGGSCNSTSEVAYDAAQDQELYFEIGTEILVASYLQNTPSGEEQPLSGPDNMTIQTRSYDNGHWLSPLEYQRAKAAAIVRGSRPPIADPVNNAGAVIKAQQILENTNVNNGQPSPGSRRRENSDSTTITPGVPPQTDAPPPPELKPPLNRTR